MNLPVDFLADAIVVQMTERLASQTTAAPMVTPSSRPERSACSSTPPSCSHTTSAPPPREAQSVPSPIMLPVPDDREALLGPDMITSSSRPTLNLAWGLMPHWTQALTPVPGSGLDASLEAAKLTLAQATLEVIRELQGVRTDLWARMRARYPTLAALLDGCSRLPPLPAQHTTERWDSLAKDGILRAISEEPKTRETPAVSGDLESAG